MKCKIHFLIIFSTFLLIAVACDKNTPFNAGENITNTTKSEIRTDEYTKISEKEDLEKKISQDKNVFKKIQSSKKYNISATVTFNHEEDDDRFIYEIVMDNYTEELKNVIQSFTLEPSMIDYLLTGDLTTTNALNDTETNLKPNKEPFGLSLFRGYVINKETINKQITDFYRNMYIKISYGEEENRTEEYWCIEATPSKEIIDYFNSLENKV
ncbi:hypothetical protein MKX50_07135 [Paenibacillus sp. FSL W8-0186]|uniref:hypothetical protein n=1 Tax=Paenibacillus sp. FSL W8-0186 TaxID=2921709 RepID=UPI0030CD94AD